MLQLGSAGDVRITGGDLTQMNGDAVRISGIAHLKFTDESNSGGNLIPAATNQAVLMHDGIDVTAQVLAGP